MTTFDVVCPACGATVGVEAGGTGEPSACPSCETRFDWRGGVLVVGSESNAGDYPADIDDVLTASEREHFWFTTRNNLILATMRELVGRLEGKSVVDIGCGTGFVLQAVERAGMSACGLDMHLSVLDHARRRTGALLICHDASSLPLVQQFDVALLCDVIEHSDDDAEVLRAAARVVIPRGSVVVTVPAAPALWSPFDVASGHKRRYTRAALVEALRKASLEPVAVRNFNMSLYLPQLLQRLALRRRAPRDPGEVLRRTLVPPPSPLNAALRLVGAAEIPLSRLSPPFGTSIIAVARVAG